jgi:hypothetical protein
MLKPHLMIRNTLGKLPHQPSAFDVPPSNAEAAILPIFRRKARRVEVRVLLTRACHNL